MKVYKAGLLLGLLSIVSSLLFCGIPVGRQNLLLAYFIIYLLLIFLILVSGLFAKKDKTVVIVSIISFVLLFAGTILAERMVKFFLMVSELVVLGWLVPFALSVSGLYRTVNNKKDYNKVSLIICIVALVLSIANLVAGLIMNGGFIIQ